MEFFVKKVKGILLHVLLALSLCCLNGCSDDPALVCPS